MEEMQQQQEMFHGHPSSMHGHTAIFRRVSWSDLLQDSQRRISHEDIPKQKHSGPWRARRCLFSLCPAFTSSQLRAADWSCCHWHSSLAAGLQFFQFSISCAGICSRDLGTHGSFFLAALVWYEHMPWQKCDSCLKGLSMQFTPNPLKLRRKNHRVLLMAAYGTA